jgi:DNA modification methylase
MSRAQSKDASNWSSPILPIKPPKAIQKRSKNAFRSPEQENNKVLAEDHPVHNWYRFVLSYPPHLVRDYLERFAVDRTKLVLDPFCGTGTTLVECKKLGIECAGIEQHPMACFASRTKLNWNTDPDGLLEHARKIAKASTTKLRRQGIREEAESAPLFDTPQKGPRKLRSLSEDCFKLLLKDSIDPIPLHKTLVLLDTLENHADTRFMDHEKLALAKAVVFGISNLHFGPEVGVRPGKINAPVVETWLNGVQTMAKDLRDLQRNADIKAVVHQADSRHPLRYLKQNTVDVVITSPPYPNEKDYTRTTRLESVLLGLIRNKKELRALKQGMIRSNTRNVYKCDDDDLLVSDHPEIIRIADAIEQRRIELGKTSGFERLYARVTKLYFGGMKRHLYDLRTALRPGAHLAYVVGDQASYLRVMIRTGQLLADLASSIGYDVLGIDLFRTRLSTVTKEQLREEVVLLRWPGRKRRTRSSK